MKSKAKDRFLRIDDEYGFGTSWLIHREYDTKKYMNKTKNADCEISIETDFGIYKVGAKNGKPFQKLKK